MYPSDMKPEEALRRRAALRGLTEHPGWALFKAMLESEVQLNLQRAASTDVSHRANMYTGSAVLASHIGSWPEREYVALTQYLEDESAQ